MNKDHDSIYESNYDLDQTGKNHLQTLEKDFRIEIGMYQESEYSQKEEINQLEDLKELNDDKSFELNKNDKIEENDINIHNFQKENIKDEIEKDIINTMNIPFKLATTVPIIDLNRNDEIEDTNTFHNLQKENIKNEIQINTINSINNPFKLSVTVPRIDLKQKIENKHYLDKKEEEIFNIEKNVTRKPTDEDINLEKETINKVKNNYSISNTGNDFKSNLFQLNKNNKEMVDTPNPASNQKINHNVNQNLNPYLNQNLNQKINPKIKNFSKVKLVRTKDKPTDKLFKHEIYLKGEFEISEKDPNNNKVKKIKKTELYIPLDNFDKINYISEKNTKNLSEEQLKKYEAENSLFEVCEFFSKIFKLSNLLLEQYKTYLKFVNLHSLLIFNLHSKIITIDFSNYDQKEEIIISELIKNIQLDFLINSIPNYIEFLTKKFIEPIKKDFTENFIEQISIDKEKIAKMKKFQIYNDVTNIINKFLNFFMLKWRECTVEDFLNQKDKKISDLQSNYFYILLIKIQHYFKNFFPYCCGNSDDDEIAYAKSPFIFCFECKTLICINCFKNHKTHNYFDFANFNKFKDKNINSNKEEFLNYKNGSHQLKKDSKENYSEDIIMETILKNFDSKINSFFQSAKESSNILGDKKFFTIFDFIEIFLVEHLFKLVFPFLVNKNEKFNSKNEFLILKRKMSEEIIFTKAIAHSIIKLNRNCKSDSNWDLKKVTIEDYYKTCIEEYIEHKTLNEYETKFNRFIIEDLFYDKMSQELKVSKNLIMSNSDLNYEVPSNDFALMISQINSPKQFYTKLFDSELKNKNSNLNEIVQIETIQDFKPKIVDSDAKYNKFLSDFTELVKCETTKTFASSLKYNFSVKKEEKKINEGIKNVLDLGKKLISNYKFIPLINNKKDSNLFNLNQIITKVLINEKSIAKIVEMDSEILYVENSANYNEICRIKLKDGYVSKYELICLYIEDLLNKLSNYGIIKYKYKF